MIQYGPRGGILVRKLWQVMSIDTFYGQWSWGPHELFGELHDALLDWLIRLQTLPVVKYEYVFNVEFIWQFCLYHNAGNGPVGKEAAAK